VSGNSGDRGEDSAMIDDEERALYSVRPEEFVQARNDLARAWRKVGRREDATRVAKLRRPSPTAWLLNQVAREEPALLEELLVAGARLREAMQRAVQGDASDVRPAQAAERKAADAVTTSARRRLDQQPRGTDLVAQRITNMLRAAVLDDTLAQQLRDGMLDIDVESSGFGLGELTADPPPAASETRSRRPAPKPRAEAKGREAKDRDAKAEAAAKAEAERRAAEAARRAADAERLATVADNAEHEVEVVSDQIAQLQERLRTAKDEARRARRDADKAQADAAKAR